MELKPQKVVASAHSQSIRIPTSATSHSGKPSSPLSSAFTLTTRCADQPGILASLTAAIRDAGGNILDAQQFDDFETKQFFSRTVFQLGSENESNLHSFLDPLLLRFDMKWSLRDGAWRPKVIIMASKHQHCLGELLYRWMVGELPMEIVGIISNHPAAFFHGLPAVGELPFYYLPVTRDTKTEQEAKIWEIVQSTSADLVVLARYMQILSDDLVSKLSGMCINIHHSFLPSFKGAKPYHQAHARGVKLIGATAHYVTADLDEGPIIEQGVQRISHRDTPEELTRKGSEIERMVLARAVRYHLEDRVMLDGHRTVVFAE